MIVEYPWLGPLLAWSLVVVLLALIVVAVITREGAGHLDYIATLIGSLFVAISAALYALRPSLLHDVITADELGTVTASLAGIGLAIYLGVLMRLTGWPKWMRRVVR